MAQSKEKICRLCLNAEDDNFTELDASAIGKVKAIIPELILRFPNDTFICSKCRDVLEKSFELKRTFSKNNELIQNEKLKSKCEQIDLNTIVKDGKSDESICRICLKRIGGNYMQITDDSDNELNNILKYCVPEMDVNLTLKPAICLECYDVLYEMYSFKKDCLLVEEKIQSCYNSSSPKEIDLKKVLQLSRAEEENDFLSGFEVQDEEGTDIFDNIPEEDSRKRPAPPTFKAEPVQQQVKKQKLLTGEIKDEELPPFQFDPLLLYNPISVDVSVDEWLARVEEYKQKFGWSDYATIHKVLVKLRGLKELYVWFSNIADIMDWEQWKKKLLRAFPRRDDYHNHLKRMIARRKKPAETYAEYYADKVRLLEPLALTEEQKVSCIFGGILDVLVCCVGRVGDYKSPEELLDYFKSCDDRQSVEAEAEASFNDGSSGAERPAALNTKKRMRCFICRNVGHTAIECWSPKREKKEEKLLNSLGKDGSLEQAKCFVCGKPGHLSYKCEMNPNRIEKAAVKKPVPKQFVPKPGAVKQKGPGSAPPQKQKCQNCGGFGSRKNPCCPAKKHHRETSTAVATDGGSYIGSYNVGATAYNSNICLRCYKTGHLTEECHSNFSHKPFRN